MKTKKVAFLGLCITLAMILSFVESQIPVSVAIPGIKLGLPNLVMTFLLYKAGWKDTVIVSMIRIVLISMLFGNIQTLTFSVAGAIVSLLGMIDRFSCVAVSVTGGVLHNVGQIIAACLWTQTAQIAFYLPMLLFSGTVAGAVIGLLAGLMLKRFEKWKL